MNGGTLYVSLFLFHLRRAEVFGLMMMEEKDPGFSTTLVFPYGNARFLFVNTKPEI